MTELISIIGILTLGDYYNDINVSVCQWLKKKNSAFITLQYLIQNFRPHFPT